MHLPTMKNLPAGVREVDTGDAQLANELKASFGIAMGTGVMMVFAVLVLLFARVFQPLTILSALAAVGRWRGRRAAADAPVAVAVGDHRFPDADGHRRQELHPAGGLCHRGDAGRDRADDGACWRRATSAPGPSS